MIERYRLDADGNWISKSTGKPMETRGDFVPTPQIARDIAPYMSMTSQKMVDGRRAQRDDLARSGCRIADPSEWKVTYNQKKNAVATGGEWEPRAPVDLGSGYKRGPS
jgi:hypothetical protein